MGVIAEAHRTELSYRHAHVAFEGRDAHFGEGGLECGVRPGIGRAGVVGDREHLEGVRLVTRNPVDLPDLDVLFAESPRS